MNIDDQLNELSTREYVPGWNLIAKTNRGHIRKTKPISNSWKKHLAQFSSEECLRNFGLVGA